MITGLGNQDSWFSEHANRETGSEIGALQMRGDGFAKSFGEAKLGDAPAQLTTHHLLIELPTAAFHCWTPPHSTKRVN